RMVDHERLGDVLRGGHEEGHRRKTAGRRRPRGQTGSLALRCAVRGKPVQGRSALRTRGAHRDEARSEKNERKEEAEEHEAVRLESRSCRSLQVWWRACSLAGSFGLSFSSHRWGRPPLV